jgi:hypothetical protein
LVTITHENSSYQVFHSFYEEILSEFPISIKARNLFLSLAESIPQTLNVTLCYVCGGTNLGDHWPWEAKELNLQEPFNETAFPSHRKSVWLLKISIIKNYCISRPKGQFSTTVGDLTDLGQKFYNDSTQETQWWEIPNHTEPHSPTHWPMSLLSRKLKTILPKQIGRCPGDYIGFMGEQAYMVLPSCTDPVYWIQSGHPFSCSNSHKVKHWESPYIKKRQVKRNGVPYKLVIRSTMSGFLSESSSIMVLPLGQKMSPGAITPQSICSTALFGFRQ